MIEPSHLKSFNGAVIAEEAVLRHILDIRVPQDDVSEGGSLDFLHYIRWIGVLEPEPVSVSDRLELNASDRSSQLAEH